jgi:hypothetical protein
LNQATHQNHKQAIPQAFPLKSGRYISLGFYAMGAIRVMFSTETKKSDPKVIPVNTLLVTGIGCPIPQPLDGDVNRSIKF